MQRPMFRSVGSPLVELDTPALVVSSARLLKNIQIVDALCTAHSIRLRPNASIHRCPALAHEQVRLGSPAGISVDTLSEAELFVQNGLADVAVRGHLVTDAGMARVCALAVRSQVRVTIDEPANAKRLSDAAVHRGVVLRVLVEMNLGGAWCGVQSRNVAEVCRYVGRLPGLMLAGVTADIPERRLDDPEVAEGQTVIIGRDLALAANSLGATGQDVNTVSLYGVDAWGSLGDLTGVTEVVPRDHPLGDATSAEGGLAIAPAARVLTTVTSCPERGRAIADAGQKAISSDRGLPVVDGRTELRVVRLAAEHCLIDVEAGEIRPGDKLWLIPADIAVTANLHDYLFVGEDARLDATWNLTGRGLY